VGKDEVDLSVLWPFTAEQIGAYIEFLRREGAMPLAAAVEAAVPQWLGPAGEPLQPLPAPKVS
jgi:hypothetical protein